MISSTLNLPLRSQSSGRYKKELIKPKKSWTYGIFKVQAYSCDWSHGPFYACFN